MKKKLLAVLLLVIATVFMLGCKEKPPVDPPVNDDPWAGKTAVELSVSDAQLSKEYDISEWEEDSKSFMVTVEFDNGEKADFPITDSHFSIPESDLEKLKKVNRVRVHLSLVDDESLEITFYIVMVSYEAQETSAIEKSQANMVLVYRENGYIVFKVQKNGSHFNGGVLDYTYTAGSITLGEPVLSLKEKGEQVTFKADSTRIRIFFAALNLNDGDIICKVPFTGDYRLANITQTGSSNLAYYGEGGDVVEISNTIVTYYTSLK